jgi:ParB family transcriptional regulator, chromosome partitioning protein
VHHPKQRPQKVADDAKWKGEQEKQRREHAIANATDLRVLAAVSAAVPVRLIKRDLLFILEKLITLIDERRLEVLARQHGIRQKRDDGGISKTLTAFLPPPGFSECIGDLSSTENRSRRHGCFSVPSSVTTKFLH